MWCGGHISQCTSKRDCDPGRLYKTVSGFAVVQISMHIACACFACKWQFVQGHNPHVCLLALVDFVAGQSCDKQGQPRTQRHNLGCPAAQITTVAEQVWWLWDRTHAMPDESPNVQQQCRGVEHRTPTRLQTAHQWSECLHHYASWMEVHGYLSCVLVSPEAQMSYVDWQHRQARVKAAGAHFGAMFSAGAALIIVCHAVLCGMTFSGLKPGHAPLHTATTTFGSMSSAGSSHVVQLYVAPNSHSSCACNARSIA